MSLRRSPEISGLRQNTSCIGETPATESELFLYRLRLDFGKNIFEHLLGHLGVVLDCALLFIRLVNCVDHLHSTLLPPIYNTHHSSGTDEGQLCATLDTRYQTWADDSRCCRVSVVPSSNGPTACSELPSHKTYGMFTRSPNTHPRSSYTSITMLFRRRLNLSRGRLAGDFRALRSIASTFGSMCCMRKLTDQDVAFRVTEVQFVAHVSELSVWRDDDG